MNEIRSHRYQLALTDLKEWLENAKHADAAPTLASFALTHRLPYPWFMDCLKRQDYPTYALWDVRRHKQRLRLLEQARKQVVSGASVADVSYNLPLGELPIRKAAGKTPVPHHIRRQRNLQGDE